MTINHVGGYEARESRTRTALAVASWSIIPVTFLVAGVLNWDTHPWLLLSGLLFEVLVCGVLSGRIRRAMRRERRFGIGSDGVYLGPDDDGRPATLQPWTRIDLVAYFQGRVEVSDEYKYVLHVGVVRAGRIVSFRAVKGWSFDVGQAAQATNRFGGGIRLTEAPAQSEVPTNGYTTIPLPQEWLDAQVRIER